MMQSTNRKPYALVIVITGLALLLTLALIGPLAAQDDDAALADLTEDDATVVIGTISFNENGDIVVSSADETSGEITSYIIAPAGAFTPSSVQEGDLVIIIGRLLPDGMTVQAMTFEFFIEEEEPEATPEVEATAESTPEVEATPEMTPEAEVTEEPVFVSCGNTNHPVAARLAEEFGVSQESIVAMHCEGNGFGNIARALLLARANAEGMMAEDFLNRHHGGEGWGNIVKESGVNPAQLAPGRIGKDKDAETTTAVTTTTTTRSQGNSGQAGNNGNNGSNGNKDKDNGNKGGNSGNKGGKNK
ncbi:MAG: hypothetical protein K8J31_11490 [Anaerolineae bacterium]|nr:hypothetical protein [Anaerolineae bacterium]